MSEKVNIIEMEAVEVCPYCIGENVYPNYKAWRNGYIVHCQHCGKQIFLCDECTHADDNEAHKCDWCETANGNKCFRGIIKI